MNDEQKSKVAKRRALKAKKDQNLNSREEKYKPPKNWKHMYLRSEKMQRAKQLGFDYPVLSQRQLLDKYDSK